MLSDLSTIFSFDIFDVCFSTGDHGLHLISLGHHAHHHRHSLGVLVSEMPPQVTGCSSTGDVLTGKRGQCCGCPKIRDKQDA